MKDCFIICPLDKPGSLIRDRSDIILKYVLTPVLTEKKYNPIRADLIPKAGLITTQIINLILDSPLVIADLTGGNPNVFYELAIRHATRKPYIQIIEKTEKIPFDIGGVRTIYIDHTNLNDVEEAKKDLARQIDEFEKGHLPDSPISIASSTKLLQENEDLAEKIAEKIDYWYSFGFCGPEYYDENHELNEKVNWLTSNGFYRIADLDRKLSMILQKLDDNQNNS